MMCNEKAATWIKGHLVMVPVHRHKKQTKIGLFDGQQPQNEGQGLKLDKRHLKHANMSLIFQES